MPDSCYVSGEITCPSCHQPILESVRCQWGVVPYHEYYQLGDRVRWVREQDGRIVESFVIREDHTGILRWNCGSPEYPNVILFDIDLALPDTEVVCPNCQTQTRDVIAVVRDGVFQEVRALDAAGAEELLGTSVGKADIVVVREDGTYWPREDWFGAGVTFVKGAEIKIE